LIRLGLLASDSGGEDGSNRIFGLFRRWFVVKYMIL
jgi:hypothetical protein